MVVPLFLFLWITAYLKLFFILLWQKIILKLEVFDDKAKQKAMKNVSSLPGIESEVIAKFTLIPVWTFGLCENWATLRVYFHPKD